MSVSPHFYRDLPTMLSFAEATAGSMHSDLPQDWIIVIADVVGSTKAIEAGAYKKVNTVGVACIAALLNIDRELMLPYVFGGDGATFAVPESLCGRVIPALRAAQKLAREGFGLELRAGLVRVDDLMEGDFRVRLGKVRLSQQVAQPVLSGRGWEEAERRVKKPGAAGVVMVREQDGPAEGSFDGFECRWRGVPSFNGHKLSLLVQAVSTQPDALLQTYRSVFARIHAIYGDEAQYHPLRADRLRMSFSPSNLRHEWQVRSRGLPPFARLVYFVRMLFQNAAGTFLFARGLDTEAVRWTGYRDEMVENSDFRKFDGMLRMVVDGSDDQAGRLQAWLEQEFAAGRLAYGMHKSREALVTCIVRSHNGDHQHFVDGSDGGYAVAAQELKRRLASL
jgi:hypothetical protein